MMSGSSRNRAMKLSAVVMSAILPAMTLPHPGLQKIDGEEQKKRNTEHQHADGGGALVVELVELLDDEHRHDLGDHRAVAGDEDDGAVLAEAGGEGQGEA